MRFQKPKFLHHGPCDNCGSRDNLGHYSDGSLYCFGCHFYKPPKAVVLVEFEEDEKPLVKDLPKDCTSTLPSQVLQWLGKYSLTVEEFIKQRFLYSPSRDWLIYPLWSGKVYHGYVARNFGEGKKAYSFVEKNYIHVIGPEKGSTVVLVEDMISAVKVGRHYPCVPLFGSNVPMALLERLQRVYEGVVVWLDGNMFETAMRASRAAKTLGLKSRAIYSSRDPKEYSNDDILRIVGNSA